ncbi:hypothetical protein WA1_24035 [Scytonema hofmannii PCC 7110]|uniref:FtsK domain-containing protein n=1 Tax=Scytonema hofmannii PCC 7110 TaxID=128403 RepID=A0A139X7P3_9CYAN|nr:hypothetical protein [Scytonema hofmannii]KYC40714.1 hypothetical protein WA1_24035 [Scytonema hofmannii PCC 7110]
MNFLFKNKAVLALIIAGSCHLASQAGTQFDRLQICFAPSEASKVTGRCEEDVDLVVLKNFYDIKNYAQGLDGFETKWLKTIKKSIIFRELPATNPYIPLFAGGTLTSLLFAYYFQKQKASQLELEFSTELEKFATKAYENWVIGYHRRRIVSKTKEFKAEKIIAKEIVSMRSQGELEHLQQVLDKSEILDNLKFDLTKEQIVEKTEELKTKSAEHIDKREKLGKTLKNDYKNTDKKFELTPEYQWINQLLNLPFRILSGAQGSGKSTLERFMIRLIKDADWHIICINPETNPNVWKGVEVITNHQEITEFFVNFPFWVKERQSEIMEKGLDEDEYLNTLNDKSGREGKVAIFLMESNTYEAWGINAESFATFLKQCLTNIRKWGFTVCLTAHSDNQTSISSKLKGFSEMINSAPRVDCIATTTDNGQAVSSGKALLKIKGVKDLEPKEVKLYNFPKTKDFS